MGRFYRFYNKYLLHLCIILGCCFLFLFILADRSYASEVVTEPVPVITSEPVLETTEFDSKVDHVEVQETITRISSNDTNGFKSVLLGLLGDYEMVTKDYTYYNNNNQYLSHNITTEPDYVWMCGAAIFALVLFCMFRMLGGAFFGRK